MMKLSLPWRLLGISGTQAALFYIPVAVAYYQIKGANLADFLVIQGIFRVALIVLEIPTGMLADRWNRHQQIICATGLWLLSMMMLYLVQDFWGLLLVELVAAAAISLNSGTMEAYLHEAMVAADQRHTTRVWQSRLFAAPLLTQVFSSLLGGWLFSWHVEAPVLVSVAFALVSFLLAFGLPEIRREKYVGRHANPLRDIERVIRWSLAHPRLPWLMFGPPILYGFTGMIFWALLGKLAQLGLTPVWIGWSLSLYFLLKSVMALSTDALMKGIGERGLALLLPVLLASGVLLMAFGDSALPVWLGGILSAGATHAFGRPFAICLINAEVRDSERATVLSVGNLVNTVTGAILLMAAGPLIGVVSLNSVLLLFLGIILLLAGYPLYRLAFPR